MDGPLLEKQLDLGQLIPVPTFKGYRLQFQYWPRDIQIRRNMLTSAWIDVPPLVCSNEAQVADERGREVAADQFIELLESLPEDGPESISLRWAVIIGEDGEPRLQLQSLPSDAVSLSGHPATKGKASNHPAVRNFIVATVIRKIDEKSYLSGYVRTPNDQIRLEPHRNPSWSTLRCLAYRCYRVGYRIAV
jgi:hypothetical protein